MKAHLRAGERGQATVEFAIVLPLVLLLIVGMIEFGKAFNYWLSLNHLANETARWAAVDTVPPHDAAPANTAPSEQDLQEYVVRQIGSQELLDQVAPIPTGQTQRDLDNIVICYKPTSVPPAARIGDATTVQVTAPYTLPLLLGSRKIKLTGRATVRLEQVPESSVPWPECSP